MPSGNKPLDDAAKARMRDELHRDVAQRSKGYRERALKILPHVCASCGREFPARRLRELTVHHRDHDFRNNPLDGSNWELLCLYCHDHEHEKTLDAKHNSIYSDDRRRPGTFKPFENLEFPKD